MRRAEGFPGIAIQGKRWKLLMQPRRPPSLPSTCGVFPGFSSFPHFERDLHTPGQVIWKTVNLNCRQMWGSCKKGYLRNRRARFEPFLESNDAGLLLNFPSVKNRSISSMEGPKHRSNTNGALRVSVASTLTLEASF
jgi:hypothetical protein